MIHEHTLICMNGYQNSTENMENTPKLIFTLMVFARILFWEIMLDTYKVIREKSRGEGSLIVQDTIENVSEPKFFF